MTESNPDIWLWRKFELHKVQISKRKIKRNDKSGSKCRRPSRYRMRIRQISGFLDSDWLNKIRHSDWIIFLVWLRAISSFDWWSCWRSNIHFDIINCNWLLYHSLYKDRFDYSYSNYDSLYILKRQEINLKCF